MTSASSPASGARTSVVEKNAPVPGKNVTSESDLERASAAPAMSGVWKAPGHGQRDDPFGPGGGRGLAGRRHALVDPEMTIWPGEL